MYIRVDIEGTIMRLKPFDFKLPQDEVKKKKRIIYSLSAILIIVVITIAASFAYYQSIELQNPYNTSVGTFSNGDVIFAVTIDGIDSQTFPTKGSGYVASSVTCDKSATGIWNNNLWNIEVGNLTQTKTTCNIDFVTETTTLAYKIKQQGGGASAIEAKGNPAFNAVPTSATSGLYATPDHYGTSYYYRGERNSLNNNLIFAGFQWKIVRINGDGSIRLIYNGTEAQYNILNTMNTTGINTHIGTTAFNSTVNDNKYVGYMYSPAGTTASTSSTQAQTNANDSTIKAYLDNWYANNIANKGTRITERIADNLFCNDRSITSGTGAGTTVTYYKPYTRHYTNRSNPTPTLMCESKNDRFTVSETTIGNGALTYPVGLLSADELTYGGNTYSYSNTSQYLYTNQSFWLLSPSYFLVSGAGGWVVNSTGILVYSDVNNTYGARPILNLTSGTQVTGVGSATDPYRVV